jgi:hypothetical protein
MRKKVAIIKTGGTLTKKQCKKLTKTARKRLGIRVLVLSAGMECKIVDVR